MSTTITIDYVGDKPREFGDSGASVKLMLAGGGEAEFATGRQYVAGHIAALKALIGKEIEVEGEQTEKFGFKLKSYPGMATGGGKGGSRPAGTWESAAERAFKENRITAVASAKYALEASVGLEPEQRIMFMVQHSATVYEVISELAPSLSPAAVVAPEPAPANAGGNGGGQSRIQDLLRVTGGDARGVVRAKRFLKDTRGLDDLELVSAEDWELFVAEFVVQETSSA